jgi:hypothetical protein
MDTLVFVLGKDRLDIDRKEGLLGCVEASKYRFEME